MSTPVSTSDNLENRRGNVVSTPGPLELRKHLGSLVDEMTSGRGRGVTDDPLGSVRATRDELRSALLAARANPVSGDPALTRSSDKRDVAASEQRQQAAAVDVITQLDERIAELVEQHRREKLDNEVRVRIGDVGVGGARHVSGGEVYSRHPDSPSFFRDLLRAQSGDYEAAQRLNRNTVEQRALGNTNAIAGSGGDFAPPAYLVEDYIRLARPGRVTANLFTRNDIPKGVSAIEIPRIITGTTVGPQTTQNTALVNSDLTTGSVSSGIVTIGGQQVASQQLLDQTAIPFDQVIMEDLAADLGQRLGVQALIGTGTNDSLRGYLSVTGGQNVNFTSTAPTAGGLFKAIAQLQGQIVAARYAQPTAVVMHPRRWSWLASYEDSTGRPLVSPTSDGGMNSIADPSGTMIGRVGTLLGMPVWSDPSIPTTLGAGNNEDAVLCAKFDDLWLFESPPVAEVFREPFAGSMGVLFRLYSYFALVPDRQPASLGTVTGTGLVPPSFA